MSKSLAEEHSELFHYTSATGLIGIIRSQTLFATHYAYLNDAMEVRHFLEYRLPDILHVVAATYLADVVKNEGKNKSLIEKNGGIDNLARQIGNEISAAMVKKLLDSDDGKEPLAEPYFVSFCTTNQKGDRVNKHGLLSQWRGYGAKGGYAVVFDTADLSRLLRDVGGKWANGGDLFAGDVVYSSDSDKKFLEEFQDDLSVINNFYSDHFRTTEDPKDLENIYTALMRCACRYKHWGFEEENEVRIIVIPNNKEICKLARDGGVLVNEIARKHYLRSDTLVPYIELFEGVTSVLVNPLPIKRIIVGPCPNEQERIKRIRAIEILLDQHCIKAAVIASEIPFLG